MNMAPNPEFGFVPEENQHRNSYSELWKTIIHTENLDKSILSEAIKREKIGNKKAISMLQDFSPSLRRSMRGDEADVTDQVIIELQNEERKQNRHKFLGLH
jgi:hypothetical protein